MSEPAISVVIPTWNAARWLAESLDSVLVQTERDREIIVVDDGSTDETPAVLARYGDRVRVVAGTHGGLAAARNLGLAHARGEWIAFHDADDVAVSDRLAWSREFLRTHPQYDAVFGNGRRMEPDSRGRAVVVAPRFVRAIGDRPIAVTDLFAGYPVYFQGALVPRRAFVATGAFDPAYRAHTDLAYGYRLFSHVRAGCVARTMFRYRWHGTNVSGDFLANRENMAQVLEDLPTVAPDVAATIGMRRLRDAIAQQHYRIGRARLKRGERQAARAAFAHAAALRPLDVRYQWMRLRTA